MVSVSWGATWPTITVEIGLATTTSGTGVWDGTLWDTATWGPDIVWTDVSAYVRSLSTNRGRSRDTDRFTGSASVAFGNTDGRFTPGNLSGPYVAGGVSQIRPRLPLRISATWAAVVYRLFYGFVDDWQDDFRGQGSDCVATASCSDSLSLLAAFDGLEMASQGSGETAGRRIQRILANAGWPLGTAIGYGINTMQPTTLAQDAMTELFLTADSDGGVFWAEGDGTFTYDDGSAPWVAGREKTTQVTFGPGAGEVPFRDPALSIQADLLRTIVSYARVGGTAQTVSDLAARALYNNRRLVRTDLICQNDSQALSLATVDLAKFKDPEYRPVQAVLDPAANPTIAWPHALGRRIRDRAVVKSKVLVSNITVTNNCLIDGIAHQIDPVQWSTTFFFTSATVYDAFTPGTWDTAAVWDTAKWFY
jgi:hypothetical protein